MSSAELISMEGFLEKHSTGVSRLLGKTRFWCTLQGSCMVYCKESKRSSVVESLMLGDAQMVRKTSSDRQGTQFEIVMKKQRTYVFTAASAEECSSWVRHLQQAMIHHEPGSKRSVFRRQIASDSGYEEIAINPGSTTSFGVQGSLRKQISVPQSGIYAEVVDAVRPRSVGYQPREVSNPSAGVYAEVADVIGHHVVDNTTESTDKPEEVVYRENSLYIRSEEKDDLQRKLQDERDSNDLAYGYSTLDNCIDMMIKAKAEAKEREEDERMEKEEETGNMPVYAKVNKPKNADSNKTELPSPKEQIPDNEDDIYRNVGVEVKEGAAIENLDNELKRLPDSSAAPVWISLTADDRKPLEDLKEFLANNCQLCHPSYTRLLEDGDPVVKMKQLIQEIG